jgi:hypothetical protein
MKAWQTSDKIHAPAHPDYERAEISKIPDIRHS